MSTQDHPGYNSGGTALDLVQAIQRVAAAIAAAPLIAERAKVDSRMSPYEAAEIVRHCEDRLFGA